MLRPGMRPVVPILSVLLALPAVAAAQPAPQQQAPQQQAPQQQAPQPQAPQQASPGDAAQQPAAQPSAPAPQPAGPPPVLVLTVSDERSAPFAQGIRNTVGRGLDPLVVRRPTRPLTDEAQIAELAACEEPACVGAIVARNGAIAGVVIRTSQRNRRSPVVVRIKLIDPVSGAPRLEPVEASLEGDAIENPGPMLDPLVASLAPGLPRPPPRTSLLIAVNVDDAEVVVDDQSAGQAPLAPMEIEPGRHTVQVSRPGFLVQRRQVDVPRGDMARVDFDLEPDPDTAAREAEALAAAGGGEGGGDTPWYLQWYTLAGAGAVLVGAVVIIAIAASGGDDNPSGIPVPPIN